MCPSYNLDKKKITVSYASLTSTYPFSRGGGDGQESLPCVETSKQCGSIVLQSKMFLQYYNFPEVKRFAIFHFKMLHISKGSVLQGYFITQTLSFGRGTFTTRKQKLCMMFARHSPLLFKSKQNVPNLCNSHENVFF